LSAFSSRYCVLIFVARVSEAHPGIFCFSTRVCCACPGYILGKAAGRIRCRLSRVRFAYQYYWLLMMMIQIEAEPMLRSYFSSSPGVVMVGTKPTLQIQVCGVE
jgi:hypothetical protein